MIELLKNRYFLMLWLAGIIGSVLILPYATNLRGTNLTANLIIISFVQSIFLYGFTVYFGIKVSKKLNFNIIPKDSYIIPSILSGIIITPFLLLKLFFEIQEINNNV